MYQLDSKDITKMKQIVPHELLVSEFCTIIDRSGADSVLTYPNVIERISMSECGFHKLTGLQEVSYIGGETNISPSNRIEFPRNLTNQKAR